MAFSDDLVTVARDQWKRWTGPVERIDGTVVGLTDPRMEAQHPYWTYVAEYWQSLNINLDGRDEPAWSAAFISYCFIKASAGKRFPSNENHSLYVAKIDSGKYPGLSLEDPGATPLGIGDLVWASRTGNACRTPPYTFAAAKEELKAIRSAKVGGFCSHCDIVVDLRNGEVDVIGGNVKQAVTRTTYGLDTAGQIKDGRRNFIGVIKNAL